jgi:hypothetical protein
MPPCTALHKASAFPQGLGARSLSHQQLNSLDCCCRVLDRLLLRDVPRSPVLVRHSFAPRTAVAAAAHVLLPKQCEIIVQDRQQREHKDRHHDGVTHSCVELNDLRRRRRRTCAESAAAHTANTQGRGRSSELPPGASQAAVHSSVAQPHAAGLVSGVCAQAAVNVAQASM